MMDLANIPIADREDSWSQLLILIVLVVVGAISSVIKKAREKAAAQKELERRRQQAPAQGGPAPAEQQTPKSAPPQPQRRMVRRQATMQAEPVVQPARVAARPAPPPRPPASRVHGTEVRQTVAATGPADISGIDAEIERLRQHVRKLQDYRQRRLAPLAPAEGDTTAIEARILHVPSAPRIGARAGGGMHVELTGGDALRNAIVYHEIFSAPKGLRDEAESWEVGIPW